MNVSPQSFHVTLMLVVHRNQAARNCIYIRFWYPFKKLTNGIHVHVILLNITLRRRNSYDINHECLEQVNLPIFKHFLAKKQIQFSFRLFHSRSPCLSNHTYYFRYGSLFNKYIRKFFFSDNYQIINAFDNAVCAIISRIYYVQRNEPRSSVYGPG